MKQRLRKKLHLGEFQEWVFWLQLRYDPQQVNTDELWDRLIEEIESNELVCGGGYNGEERTFVGYIGRPDANSREVARQNLENWLCEYSRTVPLKYELGDLRVDLGRADERAPNAANRQRQINRRNNIEEIPWDDEP